MSIFLLGTSLERAEEVKPLVYELVSKMARINGIGIIHLPWTCAIKVNLNDEIVRGLPRRVEGVHVVYDRVTDVCAHLSAL